jgi:uncharacterized protein (DUF427 family)
MKRAIWNGAALAESGDIVTVEGNAYFPGSALNEKYFKPSDTHTSCPWKGTASYFSIEVAGKINPDVAWYYPEPSEAARQILGRVAFWKGVLVTDAKVLTASWNPLTMAAIGRSPFRRHKQSEE